MQSRGQSTLPRTIPVALPCARGRIAASGCRMVLAHRQNGRWPLLPAWPTRLNVFPGPLRCTFTRQHPLPRGGALVAVGGPFETIATCANHTPRTSRTSPSSSPPIATRASSRSVHSALPCGRLTLRHHARPADRHRTRASRPRSTGAPALVRAASVPCMTTHSPRVIPVLSPSARGR